MGDEREKAADPDFKKSFPEQEAKGTHGNDAVVKKSTVFTRMVIVGCCTSISMRLPEMSFNVIHLFTH